MKLVLIAVVCGMFLTAGASPERSFEGRMLQAVSLPKGGMIVWIAHLNDLIHAEGLTEKIMLVPVLPGIEISSDMTNDLVLAKWVVDVQMRLKRSLSVPEPTWSVLYPRDELNIKFIKMGELLELFRTIYECRIVKKDKQLLVYPFPEHLKALCYSDATGKKRSGLGLVVGLYTAYPPNHIFVHDDKPTGKVYVLAPDKIHNMVLAEIDCQETLKSGLCVKGAPSPAPSRTPPGRSRQPPSFTIPLAVP